MTLTREIVEMEELMFTLGLEKRFVDLWMSRDAADAHQTGESSIPQMPHLVGLGKARKFHLATVRAWLLANFQQGG